MLIFTMIFFVYAFFIIDLDHGKKKLENCILNEVVNKKQLATNYLEVVDLNCEETELSEYCKSVKSYVIFKCSNGYSFIDYNGYIFIKYFLNLYQNLV